MSDSSATLSTIRLGGMASSLDTEAVIKVMMQYKQQTIDRMQERVDTESELYGVWNEVDTGVSMLKVNTSNLTSYTNWQQKALESGDSSIVSGTVGSYSGAEVGSYKLVVSQLAQAHRYNSDAQSSTTAELGWTGVFSVNGQEISVEATDTLTTIKDKINAKTADMSGAGVKAYLLGNKLVMESKETGTGNDITLSAVSGDDVLTNLGIYNAGNEQTACNLEATINGIGVSSASNTQVTTFIPGVTLNFTDTGTTNVSVKRDTDTIKSLINTFITSYNETMSYMTTATSSTVNSDGAAASSTGLLQGDSIANAISDKSRWIVTQCNTNAGQMNQDFNTLQKIGIWTTGQDNQLSLVDEEKLDDALANNFDDVMNLFRGYGDANGNGQGVMRQLETYLDNLTDPINGSITLREETLSTSMDELNAKITKMKVDLVSYEAELWAHFAAMETSVSSINSQGSYVLSALGQSSSSS